MCFFNLLGFIFCFNWDFWQPVLRCVQMKLYFCAKSPFRNFKKFQSTLLKSFKYVLCRISSFSWGSHIKGIFIAITRLIIINFIDKQRHSWNRSRMRVMFGRNCSALFPRYHINCSLPLTVLCTAEKSWSPKPWFLACLKAYMQNRITCQFTLSQLFASRKNTPRTLTHFLFIDGKWNLMENKFWQMQGRIMSYLISSGSHWHWHCIFISKC